MRASAATNFRLYAERCASYFAVANPRRIRRISFDEFSDSRPLSLQFQRCDSFELSFLSLVAVYSPQTRGLPLPIDTQLLGCEPTTLSLCRCRRILLHYFRASASR